MTGFDEGKAAETQPPAVKVLVISLSDAEDRRAIMRARLDPLGLDYAFVEGVDGRRFDVLAHPAYDSPRRRRGFGRDMTGGELGCLLSHRKVMEIMVAERLDPVLVLEDDAVLAPDLMAVLHALLACPVPYDAVRLIGSPKLARLTQRRVWPLAPGYWLNRLETTPGGAYAYLLRRSGAEKLLPYLQRNWLPVDALMGRAWDHGLDWFIVQPGVTDYDRAVGSHIGETRFDKTLQLTAAERLTYPLTRAGQKLSETFGKRRVYWATRAADRRWRRQAEKQGGAAPPARVRTDSARVRTDSE
ncbi:glycosyltransferase family 25 protein [Pelagibius sp.]|uniref:glycosyltransferase family 25 protein n=1 Tax=Pelagibius sp. TaxID=1931238 RepID=UPI003B504BD3